MESQVQYSQYPTQYTGNMKPNMPPQQLMGDIIEHLPSDQTVPSHNEIRLVDTLFQQKKSIVEKILTNSKDILIIGILFVIFSLPSVDDLIKKFITITENSTYILVGIKALLFMIVYFIVNNFYLSRIK